MQIMSAPAVVGLSVGASLVVTFSKKHRDKTASKKLLVFLAGFFTTLFALLAFNFAIYYLYYIRQA